MAKSILILSASVGAGHVRAAAAVEAAVRGLAPDAMVENLDVLTLTNAPFRRVYGKAYLELVNKAPHVLGLMYDLMDRRTGPRNPGDRVRLLVEKINLARFRKKLDERRWDVVVNTHFLPAEIIANLRKRGKSDQKQMVVTTDFETHRLWANDPADLYTTATAEGAGYLASFGVDPGRIRVTGIPIDPVFCKPLNRQDVLTDHGLAGDRPIVLQLAGGFGVGPVAKLYEQLLTIDRPVEVVVVAGRNEKVRGQLEQIAVPPRHRGTVVGFTDKMHELMSVADLVLSKPGGLTTSEVLASGAAMAVVNPIPGQESRNSDYLLEQGAAIKINNLPTMAKKVESLLNDPGRLKAIRANATRIARPGAAGEVAKMAIGLAGA